ncbi:MAG: NAD(P)H-dependent oxidoreductase [Anaerolineae bacterium]|nr:NAD(P)H-dependent oxidoreductase [Anaerolineae bacterium]
MAERPTRTLVIFTSLDGNTKAVAQAIAEAVGADLAEVQLVKPLPTGFMRYVVGGFNAILKRKLAIQPVDVDPSAYDLLFVGTPVWAGNYAPALRTFLQEHPVSGKLAALFATCKDSAGHSLNDLSGALSGNKILTKLALPSKEGISEADLKKATEWAMTIYDKVRRGKV